MGAAYPAAVAANARHVHDQAVAAATWVVNHDLGARPAAVAVVDTAGTVVTGGISHTNANTLLLSFTAPFSGKAYVGP